MEMMLIMMMMMMRMMLMMMMTMTVMFMPTAAKPYVRFATVLRIVLCLGVGVGWNTLFPNITCVARSACYALHFFHVTSNTLCMSRSALFPCDF